MTDTDKVLRFITACLLGWAIGGAIACFIIVKWGGKILDKIMRHR